MNQFGTRKYQSIHRAEIAFVFFTSLAVLVLITNIDVVFHDVYVKPLTGQYGLDIGRPYWNLLFAIILVLSVPFALLRGLLGNGFGSVIWFFSIFLPPVIGIEDYYYYATRGLQFPSVLPWLDNSGIGWTTFVTGTQHVTASGVGLSILTGISVVIALWYVGLKKYG